jgi:hypothetical protein
MRTDLAERKRDMTGLEDELAPARLYRQQIARKCTVPSQTHEERAQRRGEQLRSLKDAYQILSGDDSAALSL